VSATVNFQGTGEVTQLAACVSHATSMESFDRFNRWRTFPKLATVLGS
jgi:hypothetical protein